MAARFWRWVFAAAVLGLIALAALLRHPTGLGWWAASATGLLLVAAAPYLIVCAARAMAAPVPRRGLWPRALATETRAAIPLLLYMSRNPPAPAPGPATARPVLLLHGILCNRGSWRALAPVLSGAGWGPLLALNLEPLCLPIEGHARRLAPLLRDLQRQCGGARVSIVGHSMGGLVARALLRRLGPAVIDQIITLGTPHHGTLLAGARRWPALRDLGRRSAWLRRLNAAQEGKFAVPVTSIYSLEDALVVPPTSARLAGATLHELRGIGHLELLESLHAQTRVLTALTAGASR